MHRIFSIDGKLYRILTLIFDLICLNLCLIIASLPIITLGAALTATYSTCLKLINKESSNLILDYWHAYKKNFKQSTFIFIVNTLLLGGLSWVLVNVPFWIIKFPLLLLLSILLLSSELMYPLTLVEWGSLQQQYAANLGLTLKYLFYLVVNFLLTIVTIVFPIFLFKLFLLWFVLGFGVSFYLKTRVLKSIFIDLKLITIPEEE